MKPQGAFPPQGQASPADMAALEGKLDHPVWGLAALKLLIDAVEDKLDDPATGLAALKDLIDAVEGKLDDPAIGLAALKDLIDAAEAKLDRLAGGETKGTHSHASNTNWQTVVTIATTKRMKVWSIWLDFVNLTQNANWRLSYMVDGVNYTIFDMGSWTPGMDDGVHITAGYVISNNLRLEIQSAVAEGAVRDIPYEVDTEDAEP